MPTTEICPGINNSTKIQLLSSLDLNTTLKFTFLNLNLCRDIRAVATAELRSDLQFGTGSGHLSTIYSC